MATTIYVPDDVFEDFQSLKDEEFGDLADDVPNHKLLSELMDNE